MTGLAGQAGVFTLQRKEPGMVKIVHTVNTVMARQTGIAKLGNMSLHKGGGSFGMAVNALTGVKTLDIVHMTGDTTHRLLGLVDLVENQAESCGRMIENLILVTGREPGAGGMTAGAIDPKQACMLKRLVVAGDAGWVSLVVTPLLMALGTCRLAVSAIHRKTGLLVVKRIQGHLKRIKLAALVLAVAASTGQRISRTPVHANLPVDFFLDGSVAGQA